MNCPLYHLLLLILLLDDMRAGVVMMILRFITVANRTDDVCAKILSFLSLFIGSLSTVFLSFVAIFPEDQAHGVGLTHLVSAGILFIGGCVFIVVDTVITLRTRLVEIRDADPPPAPRQHWLRSMRWFEWMRPIVALFSVLALVLCKRRK